MKDGKEKGVFLISVCSPIVIYFGDDLSLGRAAAISRLITDRRTRDAGGIIIDWEHRGVAFSTV
jgi:hypothetical protein